jgi:hypothetical protein
MSRFTIYTITQTGDALPFRFVNSGMTGVYFIWGALSKKYDLPRNPMSGDMPIWAEFDGTKLITDERVVLGFTFDNVWVRRDQIPRLVAALQAFWERHGAGIRPTIPEIIEGLQAAFQEPQDTVRGVCFQHTSVSESAWVLFDSDDLNYEGRPFNFDTDEKTYFGKPPWELFEGLPTKSV